jgi:glycosyltransferase involved in cell wall biosynthesis
MLSKALVVDTYRGKLEALASRPDVELTAIVPPWWPEGGRRVDYRPGRECGYRTIVEPVLFNGHFHSHCYPGLGRRLRELRPDILHVDEEPYNLATFLALLAGKRVGARVLFFTWQTLYKRYPFPFGAMERLVLRRANWAIAGNQDAADVLRRKRYRGPLSVIPQFGTDPELANRDRGRRVAEARGEPVPPPLQGEGDRVGTRSGGCGPFTVGYAGRLVPEKGVELLLRACAGLGGEWRLRYLGAGPARARLGGLAVELGVAGRVRFDAPLPASEVPGWMVQLDALALPSLTRANWKEQFGRVLPEAMLCEVAVVGSSSGEIPNVIGEAGIVFPEGDVAALREALAALRADPDRRSRLARAGRARALAHFTQRRIADRTYDVYRAMVESRGG